MKNPLHYQMTEYDCGPTTMLNALSYLFDREVIPPEVIRNIMLYCLDCYSEEGIPGKSGTSRAAMTFLSNWLNEFARIRQLQVSCRYVADTNVFLGEKSCINDALSRGGVVVLRIYYEEWHYVLLTGVENDVVRMFDPYYEEEPYDEEDIVMVDDCPFSHNRLVPVHYLNREELGTYSLGPCEGREAVVLFNEETVVTPDMTIEYFI